MKLMTQAILPAPNRDGKGGKPGLGEMFSEEQVRRRANSYGPGVVMVSATKISNETEEGRALNRRIEVTIRAD